MNEIEIAFKSGFNKSAQERDYSGLGFISEGKNPEIARADQWQMLEDAGVDVDEEIDPLQRLSVSNSDIEEWAHMEATN